MCKGTCRQATEVRRLVNGSGRVGLEPNPTPTRPRLGLEFGKPTRPIAGQVTRRVTQFNPE